MMPKSRKAISPSGVTKRFPAWTSPWKKPCSSAPLHPRPHAGAHEAFEVVALRPGARAVVDRRAVDEGHDQHPLAHHPVDRRGDDDAVVVPATQVGGELDHRRRLLAEVELGAQRRGEVVDDGDGVERLADRALRPRTVASTRRAGGPVRCAPAGAGGGP